MKRYKDCALVCNENQQPIDLLEIIAQVSRDQGYTINKYSNHGSQDSFSIDLHEPNLPYSRLILYPNIEANVVAIINIIPMPESGISHIDCVNYNKLLDTFRDKVFVTIKKRHGNTIQENTEDYTIEDVIPLSYNSLNTWLSAFPLSTHPLDDRRWNAFVVSLHINHEHLSIEDFERYIKENYDWDDETIDKFSMKLESQLCLLEYYDEYR